ncbi:MAG: hypothetical protein RLY71_4492 [Pseudomonadota bacterium]|jgi:hypothetical protein
MGVMNWFNQSVGSNEMPAHALVLDPRSHATASGRSGPAGGQRAAHSHGDVDELSFASSIRAHQVWKKRLGEVLDGHRHPHFDVDTVRRDDCCLLGRWMRSGASHSHRSRAVFRELFGTHAALHHAAAEVLSLHRAGQVKEARLMLERGLFARNSVCVQGLLAQLFVAADPQTFPVLLTEAVAIN